MQLSIRDLTKLLQVNESTIANWIKKRGLPAHMVGGQYRVNRAELLEWATANQIRVSLELFDRLEGDAEPVPSLLEALEAGGIHYGLLDPARSCIRALVQVLPLPDGVDRELLLRLFLARESSASTAIGDGIAIPHVRNPIVLQVAQPAVTLAFLQRPIEFGALDGRPVHILFSIISPTNRSHLQLLSRLSFVLHDGKLRETVIRQAPRDEILGEVRRVEAGSATRRERRHISMEVLLVAVTLQALAGSAALLLSKWPTRRPPSARRGRTRLSGGVGRRRCASLRGERPESVSLDWDPAPWGVFCRTGRFGRLFPSAGAGLVGAGGRLRKRLSLCLSPRKVARPPLVLLQRLCRRNGAGRHCPNRLPVPRGLGGHVGRSLLLGDVRT